MTDTLDKLRELDAAVFCGDPPGGGRAEFWAARARAVDKLGDLCNLLLPAMEALEKSECPDSRTDVPGVHEVELPCPRCAVLAKLEETLK